MGAAGRYFWPDNWQILNHDNDSCASDLLRTVQGCKIIAIITDINMETVQFIAETLLNNNEWKLLVAINPTGSTRQNVLNKLQDLHEKHEALDIRILLPKAIREQILSINLSLIQRNEEYWLNLGSASSLGIGTPIEGTANLLFRPDAIIINECRKFIDLHWLLGITLTRELCDIPFLIPAQGTEEARVLWECYQNKCLNNNEISKAEITLDTIQVNDSGEVVLASGEKKLSETMSFPVIDEFEIEITELMKSGKAATLEYKIPPLQAPISPMFFGIQATERAGTVTRKTQYTVDLFDEDTQKRMEGYRKGVRELLTLCSYRLADGLRWVPDSAKDILDKMINELVTGASQELQSIFNNDIDAFLKARRDKIREDCQLFYDQIVGKGTIPDNKLNDIIKTLRERAELSLKTGLMPKITYTSVSFTPSVKSKNEDAWSHVTSLLIDMAERPRKLITDPYFRRRFNKGVTIKAYLEAMDVMTDCIVSFFLAKGSQAEHRATSELKLIQQIDKVNIDGENVCQLLVALIKGTTAQSSDKFMDSHLNIWLVIGYTIYETTPVFEKWEELMFEHCGENVHYVLEIIFRIVSKWPRQEVFRSTLLSITIRICLRYTKHGYSVNKMAKMLDEKFGGKGKVYFDVTMEAVKGVNSLEELVSIL